ncbi:tRNA lysidine(34) synthetase TilS, partial [bacterium]|nr:tRNA lysidine(34) synthetase TilS [bacterium]
RDVFYRPLINIKRCEIEKYCDKNGLKPNVDSSNSNIKYKRNLIRHNVIPELKKINIEVVDAINSLSQISIMDNEIIDIFLKSLIDPYKTSNFINYPKAVQLRLLYNLFTSNSLEYDREKITQTLDFIKEYNNSKSGKTLSLTNDLWLFINQKKIEIIEKQEISNIEIKIEKPIQYEIDDKIFVIEEFSKEVKTYPKDSDKIAIVDLSKFDNLILRHRKDGDYIKPLGCSGKQKLKKYLNEKKVPKHEKDKLLLLTSNNEVLWIPSIGISDNIKVVTSPTHMLKLIDK